MFFIFAVEVILDKKPLILVGGGGCNVTSLRVFTEIILTELK